jgi:glycine/D-amino acid oxidase-like deaminating enzyme
MQPGGFEHDSHALLMARGHHLERMTGAELRRRFSPWSGAYVDGYYNPSGGWAASGAIVSVLARLAREAGVVVHEGVRVVAEELGDKRIDAVRTDTDERLEADTFVFALGSWASGLLHDVQHAFRATGHPVLHLAPPDLGPFDEKRFPVFGADISRTGVYGFPAIGGVVKAASHGPGRLVDPSSASERTVTAAEEENIRATLREALPALGDAPLAARRICVYCDTNDGDLWIAPDPQRPNRIVATGGSGHAFKLAPILGALIADACEGIVLPRFRWRPEVASMPPADAARHV